MDEKVPLVHAQFGAVLGQRVVIDQVLPALRIRPVQPAQQVRFALPVEAVRVVVDLFVQVLRQPVLERLRQDDVRILEPLDAPATRRTGRRRPPRDR